MSSSTLDKILDAIFSDSTDLAVIHEQAGELTGQELSEALSMVREKALEAATPEQVGALTRIAATLLLYWAACRNFDNQTDRDMADVAHKVAEAAADLFATDLQDGTTAETAKIVAAVLGLEPAALAWVYDRYGAGLDDDACVKLLRLLAGCGDAEYNRRFGPILGEALSLRRMRQAAVAAANPARAEAVAEPSDNPAAGPGIETAPEEGNAGSVEQESLDFEGGALADMEAVAGIASPKEPEAADESEPAVDTAVKTDEQTAAEVAAEPRPAAEPEPEPEPEAEPETAAQAEPLTGDAAELEAIIEKTPRDRAARNAYIDAAIAADRGAHAEKFLRKHTAALHDGDKALALLDLARLQDKGRGETAAALKSVESAIEADRSLAEAYDVYVAMLTEHGLLARGAEFLETVRRSVTGTPAEIPILGLVGRILADLGRDDDAEKMWRRLRALEPRNIAALEFYVGYYGRKGDWQKQFATAQFELSVVESEEDRIRLNLLMADVAENRLNNLDRAAEAYKRILIMSPDDDRSFEALVALYEKSRKWHPLVEMYNDRIRRLPAEDVDGKVALLFRIVEVYQNPDKQPSQENMLAAYSRIADISPTNVAALNTLEEGYQTSERWPDLMKVLQKKIEMTEDPVELLGLFNRVAEIAITRMSNETQAIPFLEKILELDPQNLDVVLKLKSIYSHKHNLEKHYSMLRRELTMTEGPEREQILLSAAEMARDKLLLFEDALDLYEQAYRANGHLREARENLHALYNRLERWEDYAVFLDSEVECEMPDRRRIELLHKLAEIRGDFLGDNKAAESLYQRILGIDPNDDQAAARLEAMMMRQGRFKSVYEIYKGRNDIRKFVAQLSQYDQSRGEESPYRKDLNLILAKACETDLKEPERAVEFLEQAYLADTTDEAVGRKVVAAAQKRKDFERVERTLKVLAANGDDPAVRQADYLKLFEMFDKAGRAADGFDALSSAIRTNLVSADLRKLVEKAIEAGAAAGLWQPLASLLEDVAAYTDDVDWRQMLLMELGGIYSSRLLFHDEARAAFEKVLELSPHALDALDALETIAIQQEDYTALESVLTRRLAALKDDAAKQAVLMRLAALYEDLLGDDDKAADAFRAALDLAPEPDRIALAGLHRTYDRLERHAELAEVIRQERGLAVEGWEKTGLDIEQATVLSEGLGRHDEALAVLDGVLSAGDNADAVALVRRIFDDGADTDVAGSILQSVYRRAGDASGLLAVIETRIARSDRRDARAALLVEAAGIRSTELGDAGGAFASLIESVKLFPTEENVGLMLSMAESVDGFRDAAAALRLHVGENGAAGEAGFELDSEMDALMSRRLGELYGRRLGEPALAVAAMERAMPAYETDPDFLAEMLSLYQAVGAVDSAMAAFDRLAGAQDGADARRTRISKALYAAENTRIEEAVVTLRGLAQAGFDPEADSLLEDLLYEHGRYGELIDQLQERAGKPQYESDAADINFRIAGIYRDHLKLATEAARFVTAAISASDGRPDMIEFAEKLVLDRATPDRRAFAPDLVDVLTKRLDGVEGAANRVTSLLRVAAELCDTPDCRVAILNRIAGVQKASGDVGGRFDTLSQAIGNVPDDPELAVEFVRTAIEAGAQARAVERLLHVADMAGDEARVRLSIAAADLARDELKDLGRAVGIYEDLLVLFPDRADILLALDSALEGLGRNPERVAVQDRLSQLAGTLVEKRTIRLRAAGLAVESGDDTTASGFLRFVVDSRPDEEGLDALAIEGAGRLVDVSMSLEDFATAAEMHLMLGRYLDDPAQRREHIVAAGAVTRDMIADLPAALDIFCGVLDGDPTDLVARASARDLARQTENLPVLLKLLSQDVEMAADEGARNEALLEIAEVNVRLDVNDNQAALESLGRVLGVEPANGRALAILTAMFADPEFSGAASEMVQQAAVRSGDNELLVKALRVSVGLEKDPVVRVEKLQWIGRTCVALERNAEAVAAFADAFLELPMEAGTLQVLFDELVRQGRLELLLERVDAACANTPDDAVEARLELRRRAAVMLGGQAGQAENAFVMLRRALAERESDPEIIRTLLTITQDAGMWLHYVEVQRLNIAYLLATPDEKADAWLECAGIYADPDKLNDQDAAAECYREALAIRPLDRAALDVLGKLLAAAGDKEGLRILWECELNAWDKLEESERDAGRVTRLRISIAENAFAAGAIADAVEIARRIVAAKPADAPSIDVVTKIYRETLDLELFDALTGLLAERNENRRLLDLYRFVYSKKDVPPGPEVCLRKSIELDEKLRLHDFRFEDMGRLVEIVPADAENRSAYIDVGRKLGRMARVATLLERTFQAHQDADIAFELAMDLAEILEKDLRRPDDASGYLRLAFLRRPEDESIVRKLAETYMAAGSFGELALLYENLGDLTGDPAERVRHYFEAASVVRDKVGNPEGAAEILKKILDVEPGNMEAIGALEQIARNSGNYAELAVWLDHRAEMTGDAGERRELRVELASVYADRLDRTDDASRVLEALLDEFPQDMEIWTALEKALVALGDFYRLADSYMRLAGTVSDSAARIDALKKAASVYESRLEDRFQAMHALQEILKIDAADAFACVRLSDLLESSGDYDELADLLVRRFEATTDEGTRTGLALQIAELLNERLGRPGDAVAYYKAALDLDPSIAEARAGLLALIGDGDWSIDAALTLEDVYARTGENDRLIEVLRRELSMMHTAGERAAVLMRMADVWFDGLKNPAEALKTVGEALAEVPGQADVLERLGRIAEGAGLWREAYAMAVHALDAAGDPDAVLRLQRFAGTVAMDRLDDAAAAVRHFETVLNFQTDDLEVLSRLDDLYGRLDRREDRTRVLRQRIALMGDEVEPALQLRLAAALMDDSRDVDTAFELARKVLRREPGNQEALRFMTDITADPIVGRRAMDVLRRAFRESSNDADLLRAVENQILATHETADLVELHCEAAAAASGLGNMDLELTHLGAALALDPSSSQVLEKVVGAARRTTNGKLAWAVLRRASQAASWPDLEKKLLLDAVDLAAELGFDSPAEIEAALARVLEIDPSNRAALDLLDSRYGDQGRLDEQIGVLRHKLRLNLTQAERVSYLMRLGAALEARREYRQAVEAFEDAAVQGAGDLNLLNRLRALYLQLGDVRGQIDTIDRIAAASMNDRARVAGLMEVATLQQKELGDVKAARATLERVISEDPTVDAARTRLEAIYEELGEYESLIRLLTNALDLDLPMAEKVRCALKAASVAENETDNVSGAISLVRWAANQDPTSNEVQDELMRLYYKTEDWTSMISVMRTKAQSAADPAARVQMLAGAVQIAVENLGDSGLAAIIAQEILDIDPENDVSLLMLARMHESRSEDDAALAMYRRLKAPGRTPDYRIEGLLGTARLLMKRDEGAEEASECLAEAAAINPNHPAVNQFLKRSYMDSGNYAKVVECLQQELADATTDEDRAAIAMDIAEIWLNRLGDGEKFMEFAQQAYRYRKDDPRVVGGLVDWMLKNGREREAVPYLEWLVNYLEAKRRLRELPPYANALGRILEAAGESRRAVEFYRICHEHDASNIDNALALGRLHIRHNDMEKALRVLQPMLLRIDSLEPDQKKEILLSLARINETRGDLKKARQFVNRLLTEQPNCAEAREMLSRL